MKSDQEPNKSAALTNSRASDFKERQRSKDLQREHARLAAVKLRFAVQAVRSRPRRTVYL